MLKKSSVSDTMSSYIFYSIWDVADFSEVQAGEMPGSKHPNFEMYAEVYVGMRKEGCLHTLL